jgi:hypothetical protein
MSLLWNILLKCKEKKQRTLAEGKFDLHCTDSYISMNRAGKLELEQELYTRVVG